MPANPLIPTHFPIEFETQWKHLTQQKDSRLRALVTPTTVKGESKKLNRLGLLEMSKSTTRLGKTVQTDLDTSDRWIRTVPYDLAVPFDEWDDAFLGEVVLPTSETMQSMAAAFNRACDTEIITAALGDAYTGDRGVTPVALPAAQKVAVNYVPNSGTPTNSGLTLGKLIKIKSMFGKNEVDEDETKYLVVSQAQLDDLLNNVNEAKSADYTQVRALYDGTVTRFMGFEFVRSERLPIDGSNRTIFAFVKSGIVFGDGERKVHSDILPTQKHALQIRTTAKFGATRFDDKKVVSCVCLEA